MVPHHPGLSHLSPGPAREERSASSPETLGTAPSEHNRSLDLHRVQSANTPGVSDMIWIANACVCVCVFLFTCLGVSSSVVNLPKCSEHRAAIFMSVQAELDPGLIAVVNHSYLSKTSTNPD